VRWRFFYIFYRLVFERFVVVLKYSISTKTNTLQWRNPTKQSIKSMSDRKNRQIYFSGICTFFSRSIQYGTSQKYETYLFIAARLFVFLETMPNVDDIFVCEAACKLNRKVKISNTKNKNFETVFSQEKVVWNDQLFK
jgi:hypothetical protein